MESFEIVSLRELARRIGKDVDTVRRWRDELDMPVYDLGRHRQALLCIPDVLDHHLEGLLSALERQKMPRLQSRCSCECEVFADIRCLQFLSKSAEAVELYVVGLAGAS